jgi:outer membrane lipoprotein-sorting protein
MKCIKLVLLLTVFLQFTVSGESASLAGQLKKNYSGATFVYGEFEQSIFWPVREKTTKSAGTLSLAPVNKFRVDLGQELYVSNGVFCWHYSKNTRQCTIENIADLDRSAQPSYLLSNLLDRCIFKETGRSGREVTLEAQPPAGQKEAYTKVKLTVQPATAMITSASFTDQNSNIHTYLFKKTVFKKQFPVTHFEFEVPRDAEIIDHRH